MKVILQKTVPNLGDAGEIKEVANGYAVNYLIPRKLVIAHNANSQKQYQFHQELIEKKSKARMKELEVIFEQIKDLELTVPARVGLKNKLFGSISSQDISKALENEKEIFIEKRKIEIARPIKETGSYKVTIKLAAGLQSEIKVDVVANEDSKLELIKLEEEEKARQEARALYEEQNKAAEEADAAKED